MKNRFGRGVQFSFITAIVNAAIRHLTQLCCRVYDEELERVPEHGPLIIVGNHINFLDVPLILTRMLPRKITGFIKAEAWDNPFWAYLLNLWGTIPLRRGEADLMALKLALEALERGQMVTVAPEGTRSGHGRLQRGISGVVLLALKSDAPIIPVVHYGGEKFWENLRKLWRTDFHIKVGTPFYLRPGNERVSRKVRQEMVDEIMYQMAALLPPEYRGVYADLSQASKRYLQFAPAFIEPSEIEQG